MANKYVPVSVYSKKSCYEQLCTDFCGDIGFDFSGINAQEYNCLVISVCSSFYETAKLFSRAVSSAKYERQLMCGMTALC